MNKRTSGGAEGTCASTIDHSGGAPSWDTDRTKALNMVGCLSVPPAHKPLKAGRKFGLLLGTIPNHH
jgi:hypothetical protein